MNILQLRSKPAFYRSWRVVAAAGLLAALITLPVAFAAPDHVSEEAALTKIGEKVFHGYCTSCHGEDARGAGPIATVLRVAPVDLTLVAERSGGVFPVDEVVKKIDGRRPVPGHGRSEMPVWSELFREAEGGRGEEAVRQKVVALAHFLRSIQEVDAEGGAERAPDAD